MSEQMTEFSFLVKIPLNVPFKPFLGIEETEIGIFVAFKFLFIYWAEYLWFILILLIYTTSQRFLNSKIFNVF